MTRLFDIVRTLSGQSASISIPRPYIRFCDGNHTHASVLSQLVFWSSTKPDGEWFYKSNEELADELCLSVDQVRYAVRQLKRRLGGAIQTKVKKANGVPTSHYMIDGALLVALLFPESQQNTQMGSVNVPNGNGNSTESKRDNPQLTGNGNITGSINRSKPYTNKYKDPRSIQSPAPGIDPVGEAFQNVFWPLWEGRKYARGECLKIFAELVEQCGVSPMDFAKQLAADFNARIKSAQKGFDKMHPKSYLKGRRWEDQAPVTGTTPIPKVSESKKLHNRMASIQSEINSETLYMNGIRDNDPLRLTLRESSEKKINRLNDELEACRKRLKELNKGLPGSEIYS